MSRRPESRRVRARASLVAVTMLAISLSGCAAPEPVDPASPSPSASTATPTPTATATAAPTGPVLVPDGSATDNLALFAQVVAAVWASPDNASGRAYIDALVAAGFDKTAMQVTNDTSTVGNRAESLQFTVLWGEECLVGQVGPATGEPVAVVLPVLPDGGCLIGATRTIDW